VIRAAGAAPAEAWISAGWAVAVPTVLAYLVNMWALKRIEATSVAIYAYLQPLVAGILAWLVAGEKLGVRSGIAALAIFAGVALVQAGARKKKS
jgi:drug/metabolite transporter (DMT)-like permease